MKKIDLGQTITILANFGVLAGVLFLAFELRQNTLAIELLAADGHLSGAVAQNHLIASSPQLAEALTRDLRRDDVTAGEAMQLENLVASHLRVWQNTHYQYLKGALEEGVWQGYTNTSFGILDGYWRFEEYWSRSADRFTPEFRTYVDSLLANTAGN